jgi:hypothetical protein
MSHCDLLQDEPQRSIAGWVTVIYCRMIHCDLLQNEPLCSIAGWANVTYCRMSHCEIQDEPLRSISWWATVKCRMSHCDPLQDELLWSIARWPTVTYCRMTLFDLLQDGPCDLLQDDPLFPFAGWLTVTWPMGKWKRVTTRPRSSRTSFPSTGASTFTLCRSFFTNSFNINTHFIQSKILASYRACLIRWIWLLVWLVLGLNRKKSHDAGSPSSCLKASILFLESPSRGLLEFDSFYLFSGVE